MERVEDPALLRASELALLIVVPMALKAAINLKVMNILADHKQETEEKDGLSASEIVLRLNERYRIHASTDALERILRLLASHGVFDSSQGLGKEEGEEKTLQGLEKDEGEGITRQGDVYCHTKYALNSVSRYFIPQYENKEDKEEEGKPDLFPHTKALLPSHAPLLFTLLDKVFMKTWPFLEESVLDSSLPPFTRAHGKSIFSYSQENPQFGMLIDSAMGSHSKTLFACLLEKYQGFSSVKTLVDVGGGVGSSMELIISKYPHIHGINFDQPHVVEMAPRCPGVKHVGGDMFESVPSGDAILIKAVLHNWSDKDCIKILENCYKALPKNGKVIILEYLVPSFIDTQNCTRVAYQYDLVMFACCQNGKERTLEEFARLSEVAGFINLQQTCKINEMVVLELYK